MKNNIINTRAHKSNEIQNYLQKNVNFCGGVCCCETSLIYNIGLPTFIFDWAAGFLSTVTWTFGSFVIIINLIIVAAYKSRNIWSASVG